MMRGAEMQGKMSLLYVEWNDMGRMSSAALEDRSGGDRDGPGEGRERGLGGDRAVAPLV